MKIKELLLLCGLFCLATSFVTSFTFTMRPRRRLCFEEYFSENILIAVSARGTKTRDTSPVKEFEMVIRDTQKEIISQHKNEELQKHVFTSYFEGEYEICFESQRYTEIDIQFQYKMGLEAQTFTTKRDLQTSEEKVGKNNLKMAQLQEQMDKLHERFVYATVREKALQDVNDTTNSRVLGFGILTLIVVLCAGIAQMVYLRAFFKNKKII